MTNRRHLRTRSLLAIAALGAAVVVPAMTAGAGTNALSQARAGTAAFHRISVARAAGYELFPDAAGITCIEDPAGAGAMGIHYVNGTLVGNAAEKAATPEAVVYEPESNGRLRLVALEYVVLKADWEAAGNSGPPSLFGHDFMLVTSPNRYGLPDFYALHAWIGKHNPSGMFSMFNPLVRCPAA
jgi:hypothetical protein